MFLTAEYSEKKEKYKTLKNELSTYRTEHSSYLTQLKELLSSAKESIEGVSTKDGIPNADTIAKADELVEDLETLIQKLSSRRDSISDGIDTAMRKYTHYLDLYVAEKKREDDYHAEQARLTMERIQKQQEALRKNKIIPK